MLFRLRVVLAALIATLGLFVTRSAFAQATGGGATITISNPQSLVRLDAKGTQTNKRPITLNPEGVSLQDCIDDQSIQFSLLISGFEATASIQQWASTGADCTQQTARSGGVQQCWQTGPNIPLATNALVPIKVRDLMKGAPPASALQPNNSADICGQVDLTTITVYFLYFSPGQVANAASSVTQTVTVDTVGPAPPGGLSTLPGNTRITVNWTAISGGGSTADSGTTSSNTATGGGLTSLTGVEVYCVPAETVTTAPATPVCTTTPNTPTTPTTPVTDAGDAGDAEAGAAATGTEDAGSTTTCTDGGSGGTTNCSSSIFTSSDGGSTLVTADFTAKYGCGNITGNTGTSVVAQNVGGQPLVNGTRYAVSVAATDAFGNVGPLSPTVCEVPAETTDFWDGYKGAGGKAGGGCATSGRDDEDLPVGSLGIFGIVAALGASSARRRWRKNR